MGDNAVDSRSVIHHLEKAGEKVLLKCWSSSIPGAAPGLDVSKIGVTSGEQSSPLCDAVQTCTYKSSLPAEERFFPRADSSHDSLTNFVLMLAIVLT